MPDIVQKLEDATAQRILNVVARSRTAVGPEKTDWTSDLRQALASEFEVKPATPVSEGELDPLGYVQ